MAQQENTDLVLVMHMTTETDYAGKPSGRFDAYVYRAKPDARYDDTPWEYLWSGESDFADFTLSASYGQPAIADGNAYGFEYGYRPERSVLRSVHIERYARGLKKVERAYAKRVTGNGQPESLGQAVVYLMHALGITRAFVRVPASVITRVGGGSHYRDWRPLDTMADVQSHINGTIAEWKETHLATAA